MLILLSIVAVVLVVVGFALVGLWWVWRPMVGRRGLIQLVDGSAVQGVVLARRGPLLVIADATIHHEGKSSPAAGQIVVDRGRVAWMQTEGGS
jgi:hypothetical protein